MEVHNYFRPGRWIGIPWVGWHRLQSFAITANIANAEATRANAEKTRTMFSAGVGRPFLKHA